MITRIVKMTFRTDQTENFVKIFDESKILIRNYEGCTHLELWKNEHISNVFYTYSIWKNEECLNHYRNSTLFRNVWAKTKVLFSEKAEATSLTVVSQLD